ncbi:MAG TPA: anti-sigma-F factor Fin family protein [Bacillota bacterium]|nr:anti-sigma-F factor Fin family protein [Bacillota bacterium]
MSVVYLCRHCGHKIGELQKSIVDFSALGITHLTAKERRRMLHYQEDGSLQVQAICDSCKDTLDEHPEYYELDFFIH